MVTGGETARLDALRSLDILDTPVEERYDRITRLARKLFDVPMVSISLVDSDRQWLKSRVGPLAQEAERESSFCARAVDLGPDLFEVVDARSDERFRDNRLVTGDPNIVFYAGQPLVAPGGHRVGTICLIDVKPRQLTPGERDALRDLAVWVEKEMTVSEELDRAAHVQRGLLPSVPQHLPGYEIAARCRPARVVGGDFFDWYSPRSGALAVTFGDVMGKGLPAAILMATVRAGLRAASRQPSFGAAVQFAADTLYDDLASSGSFVTIFGAYLHARSGSVRYVDAGHGLALVRRGDGTVGTPTVRNLPFGILPDERYSEGTLSLDPGDCAVIYSDGLAEALGDATPEQVARRLEWDAPAEQLVQHLVDSAGAWSDDVTALVAKRLAAPA